MSEYVTKLESGAYRIAGTRVSLDSVVYSFQDGKTPEQIVRSFPVLNLEQIYGAIAFYLRHKTEIDEYLRQGEIEFEALSKEWDKKNAHLYEKLKKARQEVKV